MIVKRSLLRAAAVVVFGATLTGQSTGPLSLRIPDETAPPGGMVQMKVWTTEVTPIFGGRPSTSFSASTFSRFAGFSVAAPNGEAAGAAVIEGNHAQIFYSGTSMLTAHYPILTATLAVRPDAVPGSTTQFALDPLSAFSFSTLGFVTGKISPARVTVGGSTSITDVVPGEGVWPAGTVVSVRGTGFDAKTSLRVSGAPVTRFTFVSATELQFRLLAASDVRGLHIVVQGATNSATYYTYMRGITSIVSTRTLLATTEPIFSVRQRTAATFAPSGLLNGNQYMALAMQNPNMVAVNAREPSSHRPGDVGVARRHHAGCGYGRRRFGVGADRRVQPSVRRGDFERFADTPARIETIATVTISSAAAPTTLHGTTRGGAALPSPVSTYPAQKYGCAHGSCECRNASFACRSAAAGETRRPSA
jgi:hypothetical protein